MKIGSRLFDKIDKAPLETLYGTFKEKEVEDGTVLRKEGESVKSAFFLLEGEISVSKHSGENETLEVATVKEGEDICFSLSSLIDGGKSLTTLKAKGKSKIAEISQGDFFNFCTNYPDAGVVLLHNVLNTMTGFLRQSDDKIAEMYKTLEEVL